MYRKRAHTLAPLTKICLKKVNFKCTYVENDAFIAMQKIVRHDTLITDARKTKLGRIISKTENISPFTHAS